MSASTEPTASVGPVAAVVLGALAGERDPELRAALGPDHDDALRRVLRDRARSWGRLATGGPDPLELDRADELPGALAGHTGPVMLVAPDVPGLSDHHLHAAREDLANGVLLSSAATGDGSPFLVALSRPEPRLLALVDAPFEEVAAAALALGGELGMLRAERRLTSLGDARALRADPLAPPTLRDLLTALDA